ncbi:hypothetical protein KXX41_003118, partial [Aspergillus fumigatus]
MSVTTKATIASFGGKLLKLSHAAASTKCEMNFNLYLPPPGWPARGRKRAPPGAGAGGRPGGARFWGR